MNRKAAMSEAAAGVYPAAAIWLGMTTDATRPAKRDNHGDLVVRLLLRAEPSQDQKH